jgi:CheY-like chemotaxis protein
MPDLSGLNILVVEDDAETRNLVNVILSRCGANVTAADGVDAAIGVLDDRAWNVVVSDIAMPEKDGYELMEQIKEHFREEPPPVMALTAFGAPEDRKRIAAAGFVRHLMKPIDPFIFARTVAAIARRESAASLP